MWFSPLSEQKRKKTYSGSLKAVSYVSNFTVFKRTVFTVKDRYGPHNFDILFIILGSLLGDANASRNKHSTRIRFFQSGKNVDFLLHLWRKFSHQGYCSDVQPKVTSYVEKGTGIIRYKCFFNTYSYVSYNWIYYSFYMQSDTG